jgi:hypothetical protein
VAKAVRVSKPTEQEPDDLTQDMFGELPPDPAETEPEPKDEEEPPADEPEPEPEEKEEEGEKPEVVPEAEPETEDTGEEGDQPEVESESDVKPKPDLPPSALKELQKLRKERAQFRREGTPAPAQPVPLQQAEGVAPETVPGQIPLDRLPVKFDDDGKPYLDLQTLQGAVGRMMEPSPQQQADVALQSAERDFIALDPTRNAPAAARMRQASEYLDIASEQMVNLIGAQPSGIDDWVQALDANGITENFQQVFPEITDMKRFVHAAFSGDLTTLRYYMDDYVQSLYGGEESGEENQPTPKPKASKVVPLPKGRPRTMAKKGASAEKEDASPESRHESLMRMAMEDPISFSDENQAEMNRLARKLGLED